MYVGDKIIRVCILTEIKSMLRSVRLILFSDVTDGNWTVVFKAQSLTGVSPFETYNSIGIRNEIIGSYPEACTMLAKVPGCFTPYRTGLIDEWEKLDVQKVIINCDGFPFLSLFS
jgi:hypothetical protein